MRRADEMDERLAAAKRRQRSGIERVADDR
jgi:hypothetical protein